MREIFPFEFSPRNLQVKIMKYDWLLLNKNYLSTASFCFAIKGVFVIYGEGRGWQMGGEASEVYSPI